MIRALVALWLAPALASSLACSPAPPPEPTGRDLYVQHCASCHGEDGRGNGPVADSLQKAPADLTRIAARASGTFKERDVMATIDGRRAVAAHGPREMPVWGEVFDEELRKQRYGAYTTLLRSQVLADYLSTIQQRE
jgi:mono/diheme cytochrome c family protein